MTQQESIIKYSDEILNYLIKFKESHPDFTFSLRQRDSAQSKDIKRLEAGQWFQGSNYLYVPLFKKGDTARKIKTIGFVINFDKSGNIVGNDITISFKKGDFNQNEIEFHKRLAEHIGLQLNKENHGFKPFENPNDIIGNLNEFITSFRKFALLLLQELNIGDKYIIGENDFQKTLSKINDLKIQLIAKGGQVNYWIFQGSPKIYNTIDAINANAVKTWTVSAHKDKIKPGDKFILWLTGANPGCYALGRVASAVTMTKEEDAEMAFYLTPTPQIENTRVRIVIEHNLVDNPVLWEMIKEDEVFNEFKGSNQGTNFTATKEQYESFLEFINVDSSNYEAIKKSLDTDKVEIFLSILRKFVTDYSLNPNDERISFNIRKSKNRLVFIIANKYSFAIEKKNSKTIVSALSRLKFVEDSVEYINYKGDIEAYWNNNIDINNFKSKIEEELLFELNKNSKSPFRKFTNQDFINDVYQIKQSAMATIRPEANFPLNQIIFGPPGTGKTYSLQKKYFDKFTIKETAVTREQYLEQIVADLNWWQVISIAVLDIGVAKVDDIFDHEFVKIKASLSSSKTIRPTIWGQLQSHTVLDCPNVNVSNRSEPLYFNKNQASEWTIDNELVKQYYPEAIELLASSKNYTPKIGSTIKNYEFITFHQSFSYEDFIEGIKPKMDDGDTDIVYEIKDGVFKKLCLKAEADPTNPYALFIDEINRGNVSAIFGELITLIEDDKRLGAENELRVKLPYSKKDFAVPSNLYIIGTMNTADRSVEALDTALRRRFCFEELLPNTSLLQDRKFNDFNLQEVLKTINDRIEALLDRDHTIGHSYFLKVASNDTKALQSVFENNIVPLLQEYFYHDYEKIALVLGEGFVTLHTEKETQIRFASFSKETLDRPESSRRFALIKNISQIESAVVQLLNRA